MSAYGCDFNRSMRHRPNADFWRLVFAYSHNFDLRKEQN